MPRGLRSLHPELGSWRYRETADDVSAPVRTYLPLTCAVGPLEQVGELGYHQLAGLGVTDDDRYSARQTPHVYCGP
ncbi:unnamed protein product [Gongylonema pulchrum]|uniref:Alpha-galactosidase n=1 Tax=Gongylonema pulchrum TaxID=637853 RepID=A0A183CYC6_9BILA|nr:unnamed protein product [Gongylonema pulchrum]